MDHEVIVVGGGIGGLTTAALLAARGVDVCLFERQSHVGGCVANLEAFGYTFEPTAGLYTGWEPGGVYEQVFSELPVDPPRVRSLSPAYVVRLPDGTAVTIHDSWSNFEDELRRAFPECAEDVVAFYRKLAETNQTDRTATSTLLANCSFRFQHFIDVQLQTLIQRPSDRLPVGLAAKALARRTMYAIEGGAQQLAVAFSESITKSGGMLRLNSPVLRLAYGSDGLPIGVDLLTGERVLASRAIISNLTIWDTCGKLIGLARTPTSISSQLKELSGWGVYLLLLGMDQDAAERLKSPRILLLTDWQRGEMYSPEQTQLLFAVNQDRSSAPEGKLAVTVTTFTEAPEWFSFHQDQSAHEEKDQATLELLWQKLHAAMPELGDCVEVIETVTPQVFYETTRRKFGMVGGICSPDIATALIADVRAAFPNLFMIGDTVSAQPGLEGICISAKALVDAIAPPTSVFTL